MNSKSLQKKKKKKKLFSPFQTRSNLCSEVMHHNVDQRKLCISVSKVIYPHRLKKSAHEAFLNMMSPLPLPCYHQRKSNLV